MAVAGSALKWLQNNLKILKNINDSEQVNKCCVSEIYEYNIFFNGPIVSWKCFFYW